MLLLALASNVTQRGAASPFPYKRGRVSGKTKERTTQTIRSLSALAKTFHPACTVSTHSGRNVTHGTPKK